MGDTPKPPVWREEYPVDLEREQYVTRRGFAALLTIGSALSAAANMVIAVVGNFFRRPAITGPGVLVAKASSLATGASILFRYPTEEDPCILVRTQSGALRAYSQVCTHLSCAVVHVPESDTLFCPCHRGYFSTTEGRPLAGPPTRRLPRIWIEQHGDDLFAVGKDA
jgi:Rieske Fe-S protein